MRRLTVRELPGKLLWQLRDLKRRTFDFPRNPDEFRRMEAVYTEDSLVIGGWEVMEEWERPLMRSLAREVTRAHGDVLEVGFGMGISAAYVLEFGCRSYTVIEPHPAVVERARAWAAEQPIPVHVVEGFWQDAVHALDDFDAILFDTFPLTRKEAGKNHVPFVPVAAAHLRPKGVFTYYSDAAETLGADHLKLLLDHFDEVRIFKVTGLEPPGGSQYWSGETMLVPVCTKAG